MDQILETFGVNWELLVIQIFNFAVLLFLLQKFLYVPVRKLLDKRQKEIEKGLDDAKKATEQLDHIESQKEIVLREANTKSDQILKNSKEKALSLEKAILAKAKFKEDQILKEANDKALKEKEDLLNSSREEIAKMVVLGAKKVIEDEK